MKIDEEILINQYGQDLISVSSLLDKFSRFDVNQKRSYLNGLLNLIKQSKAVDSDVQDAIENSNLKPSYTPCVMLENGVANHLLERIVRLPEEELNKVLVLLLSLFRIAYQRRLNMERNNSNKWWYWDLSNEENVEFVLSQYPRN